MLEKGKTIGHSGNVVGHCAGRLRAAHAVAAGAPIGRQALRFGDEQRDPARTAWREVSATDGLERSFFEQKDGRWVKVA